VRTICVVFGDGEGGGGGRSLARGSVSSWCHHAYTRVVIISTGNQFTDEKLSLGFVTCGHLEAFYLLGLMILGDGLPVPRYLRGSVAHISAGGISTRDNAMERGASQHRLTALHAIGASWDNRRATCGFDTRSADHAACNIEKRNYFLIASVKSCKHGKSTIHSFASSSCCRLSRSRSSLEQFNYSVSDVVAHIFIRSCCQCCSFVCFQ
jgi:hypothetical protein